MENPGTFTLSVSIRLLVEFPTLSTESIAKLLLKIFSFFCPSRLNNPGSVLVFPVMVYDVLASKPKI